MLLVPVCIFQAKPVNIKRFDFLRAMFASKGQCLRDVAPDQFYLSSLMATLNPTLASRVILEH
ncbi:Uncharacterized protein EbC_pEb17200620 (plasmid) [Erwinia billingiae Eb661]|uniref:Uncharacterized protein n=1 Tax=Erwinia billingiae (strain Eb661) TaxID=634500 RepID=D8MJR7_ERWBE|nr:Uncharacterized protein EbC_pEb17200620 [Erwinia billingiae Eb661]